MPFCWLSRTLSFISSLEFVLSAVDKVTVDIRANRPGVFVAGLAEEGAEVAIGAELYKLGHGTGKASAAAPAAAAPAVATSTTTPAAAAAAAPAAAPKATAAAAAPAVASKAPGDRSETRVKMTRMRTRIAQRLKESQNTAAMLTTFQV